MPWKVVKKGEKFAVIKSDSGKVVATHTTKEKAERHKRAIYANYDKKK